MRTGLVLKKLGMSKYITEIGEQIPITILELSENYVLSHKSKSINGYTSVELGYDSAKEKHITKPDIGRYKKKQQPLFRHVKEFRVTEDYLPDIGSLLSVNHFIKGQYVDIRARSKGKGYAGVMKRHNFSGLRASHGVSISHRSGGSTGGCQDPGRVFKGKKMSGQMGNKMNTVQNIKIIDIDENKNLIFVKGAVPGGKNNILYITDSIKKNNPTGLPKPAGIKKTESKIEVNSSEVKAKKDEDKS